MTNLKNWYHSTRFHKAVQPYTLEERKAQEIEKAIHDFGYDTITCNVALGIITSKYKKMES